MSDYQAPPTASPPSLSLWQIWGGMALFGLLNFVLFSAMVSTTRSQGAGLGDLAAAAVLAAIHGALAAALYFGLRLHGCAAGILLGYVLLSLISGGVCTLLAGYSDDGEMRGLNLYPVAMLLAGIGFGIIRLFKP